MGRLLGAGIEAQHLNDDVLGRTLEAIFRYGPTALYGQVAACTVSRLGVCCRCGHLDATSFHVDGDYHRAQVPVEDGRVIRIMPGYSRDHRPDLNQVVLQLIAERQAGIPLLMEVFDGNNSDQRSFRETVNVYMEQLNHAYGLAYLIADSGL